MIWVQQIRKLFEAGMVSMPAIERDIITKIHFDEQKPYCFKRERKLKKKEFDAHHASALQRLKAHLETKNITAVKDVF